MLPNRDDDSGLIHLVKELQATLLRNDKLEKENHELRQEVARLRIQVTNLKAHDNERKSMLWKKLQSSYDGNNTDGSNLKVPESVKSNTKGQEVKNPNPKPVVQEQSTTIKPPPPPPLPSKTTLGKKSVRRAPEVIEFYRALTKRESHMSTKINQNGTLLPAFNKNMIGEIENRSKYLSDIKSDTDKHRDHIHSLICKVEAASFTDISEVETFIKWIDEELSSLVDERAVLKHFPKWPERKADSLREAACNYRGLKKLETDILSFKDNSNDSLTQALQKIQSLQDRLEESVNNTEKMRDSTRKRYKDFQIPWEWMLDTGIIGQNEKLAAQTNYETYRSHYHTRNQPFGQLQERLHSIEVLKYSSLRLAQAYMKRVTKELETNRGDKEANLMSQGVRFAYTVHQFAGGFDGETLCIFNELKKITTSEPRR